MKGRHVFALVLLAFFLSPWEALAMGGGTLNAPAEGEGKTAESTATIPSGIDDEKVASQVELLQFMDMLENIDLIRDMDVLEGGGDR